MLITFNTWKKKSQANKHNLEHCENRIKLIQWANYIVWRAYGAETIENPHKNKKEA